jgi:hypothetical protein
MLRLHVLIRRQLCLCLPLALLQLLFEAKAAAAGDAEAGGETKQGPKDSAELTPAELFGHPGWVPAPSEPIFIHQESSSYLPKPKRDWILSLEAVTHAPIDIGCQAFLETPIRARLSMGAGWIPSTYSGLLTSIAASASGDPLANAILNHASYSGQTFRVQAGFRPFPRLGLYGEFGYARLSVDGDLDLASSGVPALVSLGGGYQAHTTMDMWLVEIGSEDELWDRMMIGLAFGVMWTFDARTTITSVRGAPTSPVLGQAAHQAEAALKTYGVVPTLTVRLGFDFI